MKIECIDVFPPNATNFEVQSALGTVHRYHAVVSEADQLKKFFEFKSYGSVPPDNFGTQFTKDLNNPDITNLNQLKWMFDKTKYLKKAGNTEATFVADMKRAIDGLTLTEDMAIKFGFPDAPTLKEGLKSNFDEIFKFL